MSEEKKSSLKELQEAAKGAGYILGEVTEATKNGIGLEDLKSVKDIIDNQKMLKDAVDGLSEASLKGLSYDEIISVVMNIKYGFDIGIK